MAAEFDLPKMKTMKRIEIFVTVAARRLALSIPNLSLVPVGHTTMQ